MYKSFEVKNFGCLRKLTIPSLERINLIAGVNNVGKTSLLEAMFLHCGAWIPALVFKIRAFRGVEAMKAQLGQWREELPWDFLFTKFDSSENIELVGKDTITGRRSLQLRAVRDRSELKKIPQAIQYSPENSKGVLISSGIAEVLKLEYKQKGECGNYYLILDESGMRTVPIPPVSALPTFFLPARMHIPVSEEAERFGKLEKEGKQDMILQILKLIEPRLERITAVAAAGESMLHGDVGNGRLIPLPFMGGGMVRLASLVMAIGNAPDGVVLIDEIENGFYHSAMTKIWEAIGETARQFNTQVFATTHSWECIVAAQEAFTESKPYDFRLHRLERKDGDIRAVTYDQEALTAAIETGLEVR